MTGRRRVALLAALATCAASAARAADGGATDARQAHDYLLSCAGCHKLDAAGSPTFLECNALPGLDPDNSDVVLLSRGFLPYEVLVQQVLLEAAERQGVRLP